MSWPETFAVVGIAWAMVWGFVNFIRTIEKEINKRRRKDNGER